MKLPRLFVLVTLSQGLIFAASTKIENGFTEEQVIEAIGEPVGNVELRGRVLWLYPQGEVTIKDGAVTDFDLMDDATFAAHQKQLEAERIAYQKRQEDFKAKRIAEGQAIKTGKLQNTAFTTLPARDRVDYWRTFQKNYPEVDVSDRNNFV